MMKLYYEYAFFVIRLLSNTSLERNLEPACLVVSFTSLLHAVKIEGESFRKEVFYVRHLAEAYVGEETAPVTIVKYLL